MTEAGGSITAGTEPTVRTCRRCGALVTDAFSTGEPIAHTLIRSSASAVGIVVVCPSYDAAGQVASAGSGTVTSRAPKWRYRRAKSRAAFAAPTIGSRDASLPRLVITFGGA
jgi:hypothetical protein